jgi:anti-anti-sigma factor
MEITRRAVEGWTELAIVGRLDGYWAEHLDTGLADAVREGHHKLRLDLSNVSFVSSAGIGVLVKFYKRLDAIRGALVIVRASGPVRTVLDMTRLTAMLVDDTPDDPGTLTLGSTVVRRGLVCELFELEAGARMRVRAIGGEHAVGSPADRQVAPLALSCPASTVAVGIGAFGAGDADGLHRFGEFLAVSGAAACLPADGTEVPDYLVASGTEAPSLRVSRGIVCDGPFAREVRFETTGPGGVVALAEVAAVCLELSRSDAAAIVMLAESTGLVGAALRQSPFDADTDDLFEFPDVRARLTFTAERAFQGSLALVAGVVQKPGGPIPSSQMRPLGCDDLVGHFHAAAFSFRPFKKGRLALAETVRTLFEDTGVQGVMHLVNDNRPIVGVGQSEFARGACWIGALAG